MNRPSALVLLTAGLTALGCLTWSSLMGESSQRSAPTTQGASPPSMEIDGAKLNTNSTPRTSTGDESHKPASAGFTSKFSEMRFNFYNTNNYRQFAQEALTKSESGGQFYSLQAFFRCTAVTNFVGSLPGSQSAQQMNEGKGTALRELIRIKESCAYLDEQFGGTADLLRLATQNKAGGPIDPLLQVFRESSRLNADVPTLLQSAKKLNDPLLLSTLVITSGEDLIMKSGEFNQSGDVLMASKAAIAVGCEINQDCTSSIAALTECLQTSCSEQDIRKSLLTGMSAADIARLNTMIQWLRTLLGR
jgi:hypothetical protein